MDMKLIEISKRIDASRHKKLESNKRLDHLKHIYSYESYADIV